MSDQVKDEAAVVGESAEPATDDGAAERFALGVKPVDKTVYKIDAGVRKIDAGVRRISREIHKRTDKTQ